VKIAIVKLSALGDIVHAMATLQFIKKSVPDAVIDWIVEERFAELLKDNPDIDRILTVRLKALKHTPTLLFSEIETVRSYAGNDYDIVIDLQGLIKSALLSRMLGPAAGFDRHSIREGAAALFYRRSFAIPYGLNVIYRNMQLVDAALGIETGREEIAHKSPFLFFGQEEASRMRQLLREERATILYVLGSSWESKVYPKEKMARVVEELGENALLLWGNEAERESAEYIASVTTARVLPKLGLGELKALVSMADLVIGGDSGPTHFAWALNRPSLTLFGPTPAERNILAGEEHKTLSSPSSVDPLRLDRGDFSIAEIEVDEIVTSARKLLERSGVPV